MKPRTEAGHGKVRKEANGASLSTLPVRARQPNGLIGLYRQPRSPADQLRAGAEALRRIALLSEQGHTPILPEELRDVAAWFERGCLPE
jgi:hypothetical protein